MLLELQTKSKVIGVKQSAKAVRADQARCVDLAEDADPALLAPIEDQCCEKEIPLIRVESMALLGQACGIDVGAAVAVVLKDGCAD